MIERLMLNNFRGIREGGGDNFRMVNCFVGPNNCGKTALIEALYLASICGREATFLSEVSPAATDEFGTDVTAPLETDLLGWKPFPRLWQRHGEPSQWHESPAKLTDASNIAVRLDQFGHDHPYHSFKLITPDGFSSTSHREIAGFSILGNDVHDRRMIEPYYEDERLEKVEIGFSWSTPFVFRNNHKNAVPIASWAIEGEKPRGDRVVYFDPFHLNQPINNDFFRFIETQVPGLTYKLTEVMHRIFPELEGSRMYLTPIAGTSNGTGPLFTGKIEWRDRTPLPLDWFGDGTRVAFNVALGALALVESIQGTDSAILLWEEPELFLHAAALKRLIEELLILFEPRNVQLFITTHSLEVLGILTDLGKKKRWKPTFEAELKVYRLGLKNHTLIPSEFSYHDLRFWLEDGDDPRFWELSGLPLRYMTD